MGTQVTLGSGTVASAGTLKLQSNGTTDAIHIDASQNVGIGTSSPATKLQVVGEIRSNNDISNSSDVTFYSYNGAAAGTVQAGIQFVGSGQNARFYTAGAERARIDSSGNLLVGQTTLQGAERLNVTKDVANQEIVRFYASNASSPYGVLMAFSGGTFNNATNYFFLGLDGTTPRIYLRSNGGIANYSANNVNLSDARLKRDFTLSQPWLEKLCKIEVGTFFYKDQTDEIPNLGVLAQQVESVAPELVDPSGFGESPEGEEPYKAIYQTDLQYALLKAIQEQQALITSLTERLTALENKQ